MMIPSSSSLSNSNNNLYQQTIYPTLPPCSDVLQHRFYDRTLSSRTRSISSSVIQPQTSSLGHYNIKNPMSVQPIPTIPKQNRKQIPLPSHIYDRNNNNHHYGFDIRTNDETIHNRINNTNNPLNIPTGIIRFDHITNPQMFSNPPIIQTHDEKIRKTLSADETLKYYHHDRQVNNQLIKTLLFFFLFILIRSMVFLHQNILKIIHIFVQCQINIIHQIFLNFPFLHIQHQQ
jgi:hypothetical protein